MLRYNEEKFRQIESEATQARAMYRSLSDDYQQQKERVGKLISSVMAHKPGDRQRREESHSNYTTKWEEPLPSSEDEAMEYLIAAGHRHEVEKLERLQGERDTAAERQQAALSVYERCRDYLQERGALLKPLNY